MAVLCGMAQYSIRPKRFAIRAQAVYFLHSTMPSVTCLRLSDVSVICRVTYFQFPFSLLFFHISVAKSTAAVTLTFYLKPQNLIMSSTGACECFL